MKREKWSQEIRGYLLGHKSEDAQGGKLLQSYKTDVHRHIPILRWWMFEGKLYPALGGFLCEQLEQALLRARRLLQTFNPSLRTSDRPDGTVDWPQTFSRGLLQFPREYMLRSSGIGLTEHEREVLAGWLGWLRKELKEYAGEEKVKSVEWPRFTMEAKENSPLHHWARIAKRSRWPFLHGVVAESIRPYIEEDDLNSLPLPRELDSLFELLCLISIARAVAPEPKDIRWLFRNADVENSKELPNEIVLHGVQISYQENITREDVLISYSEPGLKDALKKFKVGLHRRIDLAFDFLPSFPKRTFDAILVEAKSGVQDYEATVDQLRVYQRARQRKPLESRYLVWGIIEKTESNGIDYGAWFDEVAKDTNKDVWVFSSADDIPKVLQAAGLSLAPPGKKIVGQSAA